MRRKRFIKRLMAHGVPRNSAVKISSFAHIARVPYKNINVIGIRPGNTNFVVYITFDWNLLEYDDLKQRMEQLSEDIRRELSAVIKKNIDKRKKTLIYNPLLNRKWFNYGYNIDLPSRDRDIQGTYEGEFVSSNLRNFDFDPTGLCKSIAFRRNICKCENTE